MISFKDFLNIIILLGVIQGIITTILLFRIKVNQKANKLLAWIILLISLACLNLFFIEAVEFTSTFWVIISAILPLVIIMPIGPLVYFYVKCILISNFQIDKKHRPHFYAIALDLVPYVGSFIVVVCALLGLISSKNAGNWGNFTYYYNMYLDIPRWISLSIYITLSFKLIQSAKELHKNNPLYKWVQKFIYGFGFFTIIWLIHLVPYSIPSLSSQLLKSVGWYPIFLPLIILIYWLGINGFIINYKYQKNISQQKFKLSKKEIDSICKLLKEAMEKDKMFLNTTLKLNDLVKHTNHPQKTISYILNNHLGKTFNEFVNKYRIEEFKKRLLNRQKSNLTLTGIAFECGFNSQATFQRAFKSSTNLSPKEFQQKHIK